MRDVRLSMNLEALGLLLAAALLLACGGSDKEKAEVAKLAETCSINSNCQTPLVCAFAHCHEECGADRDCPAKERCVKGTKGHVCQLDGETKCVRDKECLGATQVCGVDGECRDECKVDGDCSKGQVCANSGECASTDPDKDTVDESGNIVADSGGGSAGKGGSGEPKAGSSGSGKAGSGAGGMSGGGSAGKTATAGAGGMSSSPCGPEARPNEDRDHATPYDMFGTDIKYCIQNKSDVDFYELKTPTMPAQGGYYVVKLTEVAVAGGVQMTVQAAADNGDVESNRAGSGMSEFLWFNAKAGATFRLKVFWYTGDDAPIAYTLRIDYTGVPDDNEPNDLRTAATPMTVGTPIHGYLFAGFETSTSIAPPAWEDWFKVTLEAGKPYDISVTELASDIGAKVELFDPMMVGVGTGYSANTGASATFAAESTDVKMAGEYNIKVERYTGGETSAVGSTVPIYLSQPYTLTVTPK